MSKNPGGAIERTRQYSEKNLYQNPAQDSKSDLSKAPFVDIHPEGKITDCKYQWVEQLDLQEAIEKSDLLPENKVLVGRFIHDARLGKTILKGAKKRVGKARLVKYLQDLKKLDTYFKKPLDQVNNSEMERFILALEEGTLKQSTGKPYAAETQIAIKKIIIKFYKWLNGGRETPELVSWIDTSYELRDYPTLNEEQINTLLRLMISNTPQEIARSRAIIIVLFDSGARIDELLNVRLKHLTIENGNYKIRIEFSKTKARTVVLPLSKNYLDEWLDHHPYRDNPLAQLFPLSYTAVHHMLKRAGNRLGTRLTPHVLRHASATYWAKHLTQYQMNYRFGWSMNSKQAARYIDRNGLQQDTIATVVETDNIQKLSKENADLNKRLAILEETLQRLLKEDKEELLKIIELCKREYDGEK